MREFIDKNALLGSIQLFQSQKFYDYKKATVPQILNLIKKYPVSDSVEVVYCKDCKFCDRLQDPEHGKTLHFCRRKIDKVMVDKFDYCSKGRRHDT